MSSFFVSHDWLAGHLSSPTVQLLDARMLPPGQQHRDIHAEYQQQHLPGAVFFDIEQLSDPHSAFPHMLPDPHYFAEAMQRLGISSDSHLIVYDEGDLFSAPRAWWMLTHFGAKQVSILAGGLQRWIQHQLPLEQGVTQQVMADFTLGKPRFSVVSLEQVMQWSQHGGVQLIDARPAARFRGQVAEPRPGLKRGHIPGSINLPWPLLVEQGQLKAPHQLLALFNDAGIDLNQPCVLTCGSGVTAIVLWLALLQSGACHLALYDGAFSEWASDERRETHIH